MEDVHIVINCPDSKWILFAVCDGHGGTAVVRSVERLLSDRMLSTLRRASRESAFNVPNAQKNPYRIPVPPSYLKHVVRTTILTLDAEIEASMSKESERESGCTLIMMAYQPQTRQFIVANVGDSRAVLSLPAIVETKDHKPEDKEEIARVLNAGSFVSKKRVGGILALSRAMGDFSLKKCGGCPYDPVKGAVCAVADIQVGRIDPEVGASVILACDGIWDVMSSRDAVRVVESCLHSSKKTACNPAEALVYKAFRDQSSDNLTCLVIKIAAVPKK